MEETMSATVFRCGENDPPALAAMREVCRTTRSQSSLLQAPPVDHILIAGGILNTERGLDDNDEQILTWAIEKLKRKGIDVKDNFDLTVMNKAYGEDQDVLSPTIRLPPAQLFVVSLIYDPPYAGRTPEGIHLTTSDHRSEKNAWPKAADRIGAEYVIPWSAENCVSADYFVGTQPEYVEVMSASRFAPPVLARKKWAPAFAVG